MSHNAPLSRFVRDSVFGLPGIIILGLLASVWTGLAVAQTDVINSMIADAATSAGLEGPTGSLELTKHSKLTEGRRSIEAIQFWPKLPHPRRI
jgi:hypothetical protein